LVKMPDSKMNQTLCPVCGYQGRQYQSDNTWSERDVIRDFWHNHTDQVCRLMLEQVSKLDL
jgi:hypothetical protein